MAEPFRAVAGGVSVRVRLTPRARAERLGAVEDDGHGGVALKAAVTAAPEDGRANAALVRLLAGAWRVPPSSIAVTAGATRRTKTLAVAGDPDALLARLRAWLSGHRPGAR